MSTRKIVMDRFALRQFNKSAPSFINYDPVAFEGKINEVYLKSLEEMKSKGLDLKDFEKNEILRPGYAPFCKHIIVDNFISDLKPGTVEITTENSSLIKTVYEARTEKELPVLKRFILASDIKGEIPSAKYLDVILYSKEQITLENKSMGNDDENASIDYDYGIISIKPQNSNFELPMDPITMMRNALGKEEGGSGVKLEREKYMNSVAYWDKNVLIKYT